MSRVLGPRWLTQPVRHCAVPRRGSFRPNLRERGPDTRHRLAAALVPRRNGHPARRGSQRQRQRLIVGRKG